jgi:hypothetical protein
VFEVCPDDDVAWFPVDGIGNTVHAICRTLGERNLVWRRPEQVCDAAAGMVVGVERALVRVLDGRLRFVCRDGLTAASASAGISARRSCGPIMIGTRYGTQSIRRVSRQEDSD